MRTVTIFGRKNAEALEISLNTWRLFEPLVYERRRIFFGIKIYTAAEQLQKTALTGLHIKKLTTVF